VLYLPQHSPSYLALRGDSTRNVLAEARPRWWTLPEVPANLGAIISRGDNLLYINRRTAELVWQGTGQRRLLLPGVFPGSAILGCGPAVLLIDHESARAYSFEVEEGFASCPRRARPPVALRELAALSSRGPGLSPGSVLVQAEVAVGGQLHQVGLGAWVLSDPGARLPGRWRVTVRRFISIAAGHRSVVTDEPPGTQAPDRHDNAGGIGDTRFGEGAG
jgi:hypothetical protein